MSRLTSALVAKVCRSKLRRRSFLSLNNTMLIAMQMLEAMRVASYRSWQRDFNRHVKRGERGIVVLVSMAVKRREADSEEVPQYDVEAAERRRLVGFTVGHVFDVSQTEGEPLPEIASWVSADVSDFDSLMGAIEAVSAYPIEVVDGLPPETNELFSRRMGYIAVHRGMPEGRTEEKMHRYMRAVSLRVARWLLGDGVTPLSFSARRI